MDLAWLSLVKEAHECRPVRTGLRCARIGLVCVANGLSLTEVSKNAD